MNFLRTLWMTLSDGRRGSVLPCGDVKLVIVLIKRLNIFTGSPGVPQWNMDRVSDKEGFLSHVALTTAHLGPHARLQTCRAIFDGGRRVLDTPGGHMELRPAHPAGPCQCIWVGCVALSFVLSGGFETYKSVSRYATKTFFRPAKK